MARSSPDSAPKQSFSSAIVKQTGFTRTRSLVYFILLPCIFAVFCTFSLKYINYDSGWGPKLAGEWYWFKEGFRRFAMRTHLTTVLPAGVLMPIQFVPIIRRKYKTFHRINGRIVLILLLVGTISAVVISPWTYDGTISTISVVVTLATMNFYTVTKGYLAIKRRDIPSHRIWMLRTWGHTGSILTMRPIFILMAFLAKKLAPHGFHTVSTCDQLIYVYKRKGFSISELISRYPACAALDPNLITNATVPFAASFGRRGVNGSDVEPIYVAVRAYLSTQNVEELTAMLGLTFGPAFWFALMLHVVGTEWWIDYEKKAATKVVAEKKVV